MLLRTMTFPNGAERIVQDFETGVLPCAEWTHEAHLAVGLWYACAHKPAQALVKMRNGINAFNRVCGVPTADDVPRQRGYHETLTRLYIAALCDFWREFSSSDHNAHSSFPNALAALLESPIAEKLYPLRFYSPEVLFSPEARYAFVPPDKTTPPPLLLELL